MNMKSQAWSKIGGKIEDAIWHRFRGEFSFDPICRPAIGLGIVEPSPSITYSASQLYDDDRHYRELNNDIHQKAFTAFRHCVMPKQRLYALELVTQFGRYSSYSFIPQLAFSAEQFNEWRIPLTSDADYCIFLAEDFTFGTFAHPWAQTVCVFGQTLINEFERNPPTAFKAIRRK